MEKFILVEGEKFYYSEIELFHGRKIINREISKENLEVLHSIVDGQDIRYGIMYGTLLGAIREQGFIKHDEDTDMFLLEEDRVKFLKLLPRLKEEGLELIRVDLDGDLISLMRKGEYIDMYIFRKVTKYGFKKMRITGNMTILKAEHLEKTKLYDFLGMKIPIPSEPEKILEILYGANWRTPIENSHATANTFYSRVGAMFPFLKEIAFVSYLKDLYRKYS